ncbi:MAG: hypothetical protein M3N16_07100, partial [Actinomycetota bacterium]|nr:hypothetical protein [Actinomycetota bacterium]
PRAARAVGAAGREFVRTHFAADALSRRLWALLERAAARDEGTEAADRAEVASKMPTAHAS